MKKINVKEYLKNHTEEIIMAATTSVLCAASFWLGGKYTEKCITCGFAKVGEADPEFDALMMAACERMKEYNH